MGKIELCKTLLKYIGTQDITVDRALSQGVITILESIDEPTSSPMEAETVKEKPKSAPKPTEKAKRKPFDKGKLRALREGGWSVPKIADEMGVSDATIYKYMKQEGIA